MIRRKNRGIEAVKRRYGYAFVAPWIFGVIVFVLVPLGTSFWYGFSNTLMTADGLQTSFNGLENYRKLFFEDPDYINMMVESLSSLFTSLPIVVALSMILALILNQQFRGRLLARAVFFLPVIIGSGVVMNVLAGFHMGQEILASAGAESAGQASGYMQVIDFSSLLHGLNLPGELNRLIEGYLQNTFNLIWSCGVQILLFVAGLQTIPAQLYEAGRVEGITAWEEFWRITIPMLGRVIMLVIFYTMVELFVEKGALVDNAVTLINQQNYAKGAAMLWPYFALVALFIGIVIFLYNRLCLRKWE